MSFSNILNDKMVKARCFANFATPTLFVGRVPSLKFGESQRLIYAQAPVSGIGLVPGRNILCKPANNPITTHHTLQKLGCCTISYRNIIALFYRHFLGYFFANLKLSLNRDTPTPLPSLSLIIYLPYLAVLGIAKNLPQEVR